MMNHHNILIQAKQEHFFSNSAACAMTPVLKRTLANVLAHALLVFHLAVTLKSNYYQ